MSFKRKNNCVIKINPKLYCCLVCLDTKYAKGINVLKSSHILELLEYVVGFRVNINYTSHVLCTKCKKKIKGFEEFKRQCEKSESLWKKFPIVNNAEYNEVKSNITNRIKQDNTDIEQEFDELNTEEGFQDINEISCIAKDFTPSSVIKNEEIVEDKCRSIYIFKENTKIYKCTKCSREYNTQKSLQSHKKNICYKNNLKINENGTDEHSENENIKLSTNECGLCDTPFTCDVSEHLENHHWLNNNLQCDLCNYSGKDFAHMVTHRLFSDIPNMKLSCIACTKRIFSTLSLQFHFRSVHLRKPGGYCTSCDKSFNKFKTWKKHHRLHTESNKLYVCDYCGKRFLYRHEIKTHLITHTDSRQYVCETCGKGFRRISTLRDHVYNIHETRQPVKCEHCNKIYKCTNKLRIHLRNVAAEKSFICEVCSRKFHTETVLKRHMFWHTGERPFGCEVCGLRYKAKGQLKVHMRKHSGDLPYVCATCSKRFASSTQLKVHTSVHTCVRRHKCMQCEKSFHYKNALLQHMTKHNIESGKLDTAGKVTTQFTHKNSPTAAYSIDQLNQNGCEKNVDIQIIKS